MQRLDYGSSKKQQEGCLRGEGRCFRLALAWSYGLNPVSDWRALSGPWGPAQQLL